MNKYKEIQRVSRITLTFNVFLGAAKLAVGLIFRSMAVVSDSVHTFSDVFATIIVMIGIKLSSALPDKHHNYGHEKIEAVFATLLAVILFLTGAFLLYNSISSIINRSVAIYSPLLIAVTVLGIVSKEFMFHYTMHYAKKYRSQSLKAEAWHHRSDALSSVAVLVGVGGALLFPSLYFLEPLSAIAVSVLICKVAVQIYLEAIDKLVDKAADPETVRKISEIVLAIPGVRRIDGLKTRQSTFMIYVDLEIAADGKLSLDDAHSIAQEVHDVLEHKYIELDIKHINVHVNPCD
jgi:cation diffusion facilitator family transporter